MTRRLVVRMFEAPLEPGHEVQPKLDGAALIVGNNPAALALRDRLQAMGTSVLLLEASDDPEQGVNELQRIFEQTPILHLFLMTPHDTDAVAGRSHIGCGQRRRCADERVWV